MLGFIIRRTLSMLVTFIVVSVVIFLMMHSITGGPFDGNEMPLPDNIRARLMAQLGLDKPLYEQYLRYMWGVLHFDFGVPYQSPGETVMGLVAHAWVPSLILGGSGLIIGAPIGILLGMTAALNRNSWIDYVTSAIATLGLTIPVFVIFDPADPGVCRLAAVATGERLGGTQTLDPAYPRLRLGAYGKLCALRPRRRA